MTGWVIAGLVLLSASFLTRAKHVTDAEVSRVVQYALYNEKDPKVLLDLSAKIFEASKVSSLPHATKTDWINYTVSLHNQAVALQGSGDLWIAKPWGPAPLGS